MTQRFATLAMCSLVALCGTGATHSRATQQCDEDRTIWVGRALDRIETIKPGMTRDELLTVFETQGGLSSPLHRSFVSRDCRYFKVDVEFKYAKASQLDAEGRVAVEDGQDIIVTVSRPYLQYGVSD
jgi:hypothetical protein